MSIEIETIPLVEQPIIATRSMRNATRGHLNINGPSLIRVPDWIERALGRYYLYYADHKGSKIELAYADELGGPSTDYEPGLDSFRVQNSRLAQSRDGLNFEPETEVLSASYLRMFH